MMAQKAGSVRSSPFFVLLVIPLAAVATAGILAARVDDHGRAPLDLDGVDPAALAETGVTLVEPPPGASPEFSAVAASTSAAERNGLAAVKEVRLAQLTYPDDNESAPKLVWAVSLDAGGHRFTCDGFDSPKTCASPRFLLQFVDANTGDLLSSVMH